jgi:hypothetical protein
VKDATPHLPTDLNPPTRVFGNGFYESFDLVEKDDAKPWTLGFVVPRRSIRAQQAYERRFEPFTNFLHGRYEALSLQFGHHLPNSMPHPVALLLESRAFHFLPPTGFQDFPVAFLPSELDPWESV